MCDSSSLTRFRAPPLFARLLRTPELGIPSYEHDNLKQAHVNRPTLVLRICYRNYEQRRHLRACQ